LSIYIEAKKRAEEATKGAEEATKKLDETKRIAKILDSM